MSIRIDTLHECSQDCFENRIKYYEERITQLSREVYKISDSIYRSQRFEYLESSVTEREIGQLHIAVADLEQLSVQLEGEMEGLQHHFQSVRESTLSQLDRYSKDLSWTLRRFEQLKGDADRTADRGTKTERLVAPEREEEPEPVYDFEEPLPRSDSPRPHRRRGDSPPVSDSEGEDEVEFKPPTCWERTEQRAQELLNTGKRWVRRNRGFAASIALNVILLAMRKFSRS